MGYTNITAVMLLMSTLVGCVSQQEIDLDAWLTDNRHYISPEELERIELGHRLAELENETYRLNTSDSSGLAGAASAAGYASKTIVNERERDQKLVDAALRGRARQDFFNQLPEFRAQIANGKHDHLFKDLESDESVRKAAENWLNSRLEDRKRPEEYKKEFLRIATPEMARLLVKRHQLIGNRRGIEG